METPSLSRLQKKLSLSGKKQKKEIIKNVVDNPHLPYWPIISEDLESFVKVLTKNLPLVRLKKINVPWNVLKDISKEDRKNKRNEYIQKNNPSIDITKEQNLIFGVNDVTKCLENNLCSIVLIAEVTPRILVKHIIDLSILHEVPILVIPGMKQILENSCGLRSIAVAIKKGLSDTSHLKKIVEAVVEISEKYPVTSQHINFGRTKDINTSNEVRTVEDSFTSEVKKTTSKPPNVLEYHLYRTSLFERAFVPDMSEEVSGNASFLSFNSVEAIGSGVSHTEKVSYKPLRVKRLKGNKNRYKKK